MPTADDSLRQSAAATSAQLTGPIPRFFGGVRFLFRGLALWATSPKLMLLGAIPAIVVGTVYLIGVIFFLRNLGAITAWATPFADSWDEPFRTAIRVAVGIAAIAVVAFAVILTFTAITLAVGDTFYERIWRNVENRNDGTRADDGATNADSSSTWWGSARRGVMNGIRMLAMTTGVAVLLFVCGFIPVVGQTLVPITGLFFGGWFLAVELTGFAFDARGFNLRERRRMLGSNRAGALGFGVATSLLFLIPLGAVVVMPAAVAGATLLARSTLPAGRPVAGR